MKKDYTHITFIIDRSGSMSTCWGDVIGGYKEFVKQQKDETSECTFSLVAFDNQYSKPLDFADIKLISENIDDLNIKPRGTTALYDAIGRAINETGEKLAKLKDEQRPEKVVVVIQTDGYENASREYTAQVIKERIKHQEDKYNWKFMFVGADQAACMNAIDQLGIDLNSVARYSTVKTGDTFSMLNTKLRDVRRATNEAQLQAAVTYSSEDLQKIQ